METPNNTDATSKGVKYHPFILKFVPNPIIKIAEDYSLNQYILLAILVFIGMGLVVLAGIVITRLVE